jgi:hypothetical protein
MIWGFIIWFLAFQSHAVDTWTLANVLNKDTQDFESLDDVLALPGSSSMEGFLANWKKQKPEYFSNYVVGYRSRSLQQSDGKNPRIIMFSANADLAMAFNGHPKHRGYSQLEVMRFNHAKEAFEFYEVDFSGQQKPKLSEPNPAKCLECHQSASRANVDPRPNWEPYNVWLGFYGSLDDSTEMSKSFFLKGPRFNKQTDTPLIADLENEEAGFEKFVYDIQPNHPRYKILDPINNTYLASEKTINGDFTNRLAVLNFRRVARLMKEQTAIYEKVKWTLWGYANCGQSFFVPRETYSWLVSVSPRTEIGRYDMPQQPPALPPCPPKMAEIGACDPSAPAKPVVITYPYVENANVINTMFEPFGVNTEDWSMDFKTSGRFAFAERFGVTNDPRPPINAAIKKIFGDDPELKGATCDEIKSRSMDVFGTVEKAKKLRDGLLALVPPPPPRKPLLERCISCHVEKAGGVGGPPPLPFNDPAKLKQALQESGYKRGTLLDEITYRTGSLAQEREQMPPRGIPTSQEREELLGFLKAL